MDQYLASDLPSKTPRAPVYTGFAPRMKDLAEETYQEQLRMLLIGTLVAACIAIGFIFAIKFLIVHSYRYRLQPATTEKHQNVHRPFFYLTDGISMLPARNANQILWLPVG